MKIYKVVNELQEIICIIRAGGIFEATVKFNRKYPKLNPEEFKIKEVEFDENGISP